MANMSLDSPQSAWHFPTVPSNATMPCLAVTNRHFHSTIHTRPRCNFSPLQWTPLDTQKKKKKKNLRRGGLHQEHPTAIVWLKSLPRQPPPPTPFSHPSTPICGHFGGTFLTGDIKHSMRVTFIDFFQLIFTYKLPPYLQVKRFSVRGG